MKISTSFTTFLVLASFALHAQEFQKSYGSAGFDVITSLVQLPDQSYLAFGGSSSFSPTGAAMVIHLDGMGEPIETTIYSFLQGSDIISTDTRPNGNIIFGGAASSMMTNSQEAMIGEMTPEGEVLWTQVLAGALNESITCVAATSDGGVIAGGHSNSFSLDESMNDIIIKLNDQGEPEWAFEYESPGYDRIADVEEAPGGGYYCFGHHSNEESAGYDLHLFALSAQGQTIWSKAYSGATIELASEIFVLEDGLLLGGDSDSFGAGMTDAFLMKTSFNGSVEWQNHYGGFSHDHITSIIRGDGANLIVGGVTGSISNGGLDMLAMEVTPMGDLIWSKGYGGDDKDIGFDVIRTPDGGYAMGGYTRSFAQGFYYNTLITKTNDRGDCLCNSVWDELLEVNETEFALADYQPPAEAVIGFESIGYTSLTVTFTESEMLCESGELIDYDGSEGSENSGEATSVGDIHSNDILEIRPNMSNSSIFVEVYQDSPANLSMYSINGQLVADYALSGTGHASIQFSTDRLLPGIYIVSMTSRDAHLTRKVFVH